MNWKRTVCLLGTAFFCTSMLLADQPNNSSLNAAAVKKAAVAQEQGAKPTSLAATQEAEAKKAAGSSKPSIDLQKRILKAQAEVGTSNRVTLGGRGAPANDNCADAEALSGMVIDYAFDTTNATDDGPIPSCQANSHKNVWFCWTATAGGSVNVNTSDTGWDTVLAVYDGCGCSDFVEIACDDDSGTPGNESSLDFEAVAGNTYLIGVFGWSTNSGLGVLDIIPAVEQTGACCVDGVCVATNLEAECDGLGGTWYVGSDCATFTCPPIGDNDNCAGAIALSGTVLDLPFDTTDATDDGPIPTCQTNSHKNVWYCWTAETDGDVNVNTNDSGWDTVLAVYEGCGCSNFVQIGCDDDSGTPGNESSIDFVAVAGQSYLIWVGGYSANYGTGLLDVIPAGPPMGACCVGDECVGDMEEATCLGQGGEWHAGASCATYVCGDCPEDTLVIELFTDNYPSETSWELIDVTTSELIGSAGPYEAAQTLFTYTFCIAAEGCYDFNIYDAYGDGICCSYGEGYYNVIVNDVLLYTGGAFGSSASHRFGSGCVWPEGACCLNQECQVGVIIEPDCDAIGGTFQVGLNCDTVDCTSILECPATTLAGQGPPDPDGDWTFANADANAGGTNYLRAESFSGLTGMIYDIHWWGLWAYNSPSWAPCTETDPTLEIKFYQDAGGQPGAVVCSYSVIPTWVPTGEVFAGLFDMLYFSVDLLDPPCLLADGWVSIQGFGSATCWFLWSSSYDGDGQSYLNTSGTPSFDVFDLSYCLTGEYIPLFGACCDDLTATCEDGVEIINCDGRFAADTLCVDLTPACGEVTGACCYDDGSCEITTQAACSGMWLGAWTTCDMCPCIVPCPPGAVAEIEPCGDDTNGGCNMTVPTFNPVVPGETICGTIWADGGTRDTDWYEIVTNEPMIFTWAVEAEFGGLGVIGGLVETSPAGNPDCTTASALNPYATGGECQPISVTTTCLPAGTYWFFVSALDYYGLPCGTNNDYTATLTATPCVVLGACCYNEGANCQDIEEDDCDALGGTWYFGETCSSFVCPTPCTEATIDIVIHTDNYPSETTWNVTDYYTGAVICSGGPFALQQYTYLEQCCVPFGGCYTFTIFDSYGDGICCAYGTGYYEVYYESELICTGGEFGLEESCEMFGDNCVIPPAACCVADVCIGDLEPDPCAAAGGEYIAGQLCAEGYDCSCIVDFCVDAPFHGTMLTTCGAGNDCALRTTEEHEYQVTIPEAGIWTVSLCGSAFDTYLYIGTTRCSGDVGENDDFCGLQSEITTSLDAGVYYVTVEGYSGCGDYVLNITMVESCEVECPPNGTPEGEPDCYDDYVDLVNGGCNSTPNVFSPITCNETVCGTSGTYLFAGSSYRDTDWFEIVLPAATTLTWEVCATFDSALYILDANQGGCDNIVVAGSATGSAYVTVQAVASVGPGTYWMFVGPSTFSGVPCGSAYVATLTADPDVCMCGDFDNDNDVDVDDFYFFLDAYGTCVGDIKYEAACDFDGDECITLVDYQAWMQCYRDANDGKRFVVPRTHQMNKAGARPAGQAQPL